MPYINDEAQSLLGRKRGTAAAVGELVYEIQQVLKSYLERRDEHYWVYNDCLGALEGAKADLIRRKVIPYEEKMQEENGDVW